MLFLTPSFQTEMQHRRRRNGHLRRDAGMSLEKLEVLQHRMVGEADLAHDAQALRLGLHAAELNALVGVVNLDAVEHAEEIEVPPGAAELAVGRELEAEFLLPLDDLYDLSRFDGILHDPVFGSLPFSGSRLIGIP